MDGHIKFPGFAALMASPFGRGLRMGLGALMMIGGFASFTTLGVLVAALGFIPFIAGFMDICLLGPALGGPLEGKKMRRALHEQAGHPSLGDRPRSWAKA